MCRKKIAPNHIKGQICNACGVPIKKYYPNRPHDKGWIFCKEGVDTHSKALEGKISVYCSKFDGTLSYTKTGDLCAGKK